MPTINKIWALPKGDSMEILETSAMTGGARTRVRLVFKPGGSTVPMHRHLLQDEKYEVLSGTMTYWLDGKMHRAEAGTKVALPRGAYGEGADAGARPHARGGRTARRRGRLPLAIPCPYLPTFPGPPSRGAVPERGRPRALTSSRRSASRPAADASLRLSFHRDDAEVPNCLLGAGRVGRHLVGRTLL